MGTIAYYLAASFVAKVDYEAEDCEQLGQYVNKIKC